MAKAKPAQQPPIPPAAGATPDTENASVSGAEAVESPAIVALRISAAREGFRRAGRAWSKAPVDVPLADLTDEQVAMLRAESLLTVEDVTIEAAAE